MFQNVNLCYINSFGLTMRTNVTKLCDDPENESFRKISG